MQRLMAVAIFVMMFTLETGNCLSPASGQSSPQARDSSLALVGARVYPSPTERPISNAVVLIKNGRISAVGQNGKLSIPPGTRRIDCSGLTLTAGFWNSHVHLAETKWENASTIPAPELTQQLRDIATRYGFTTVFDTGSVLQNTKIIHQRIESGEVDGPRILTTGPIFYPKGVCLQPSWSKHLVSCSA